MPNFTYIYSDMPGWVGLAEKYFLTYKHSMRYGFIFFGICRHFSRFLNHTELTRQPIFVSLRLSRNEPAQYHIAYYHCFCMQ